EDDAGLLFVGLLGERELGDEDLLRLGEHALLTRGETAVLIAAPQVAHDLAHLDDITGSELLEIGLVAARPVGRLLREGSAQHFEDLVETLFADDVAYADQIDVLCGYFDDE